MPTSIRFLRIGQVTTVTGGAASARATKYRPFKTVEGGDADSVTLDPTTETQVLLENLPAKAVVHFEVTGITPPATAPRARWQV